jgi:hypothetical protein
VRCEPIEEKARGRFSAKNGGAAAFRSNPDEEATLRRSGSHNGNDRGRGSGRHVFE